MDCQAGEVGTRDPRRPSPFTGLESALALPWGPGARPWPMWQGGAGGSTGGTVLEDT